jgi:sigma-B regulation protein RsbU (phosphoserine phosphatase)
MAERWRRGITRRRWVAPDGYLVPPGGILTGIDEGAVYAGVDLQLELGDTLLRHTDGVTEAMHPCQTLFGDARLLDCLNRDSNNQAAAVTGRIRAAVDRFVDGAPQADDLTMVAVRRIA